MSHSIQSISFCPTLRGNATRPPPPRLAEEDEDHLAQLGETLSSASEKPQGGGNYTYSDIVSQMKATYNAKLQRQASMKEKSAFAEQEKRFRESCGWKIGRLFLSDWKIVVGVTSASKVMGLGG